MTQSAESLSSYEAALRDQRAARYDADYQALHGPWFPMVELGLSRRLLRLQPDDVLLDFGCGTGRLTLALAGSCQRVLAVDRSRASLEVLGGRARAAGIRNIETFEADVSRPIRLPVQADKVISVQLLQHVPSRENQLRALRNAFGGLLPGGRAVFIDEVHGLARRLRAKPREIAEEGDLYFHPFEPREARALFRDTGFEAVRASGCGILYWSRYRAFPLALTKVDAVLSALPGYALIAKFMFTVGTRPLNAPEHRPAGALGGVP